MGTTSQREQIWNNHKRAWFTGIALLVISLLVTSISVIAATRHPPAGERNATATRYSSAGGRNAVHFGTLPPGAKLPSGAECARLVRGSPNPEDEPMNARFNRVTGQHVPPGFFSSGDSPQAAELAPLITGDFTGTTAEILEWAACKWGISQDIVFAQAAVESSWQQTKLGDWTADVNLCPPGHGIGADGTPGECPQSYGILQDKYRFEKAAWPGIAASTAMNVDAAYAIWRSCYDGFEVWLGEGPMNQLYRAGDLWGCVGRWFSGDWYSPEAQEYIDLVKKYAGERVGQQPSLAPTP